MIKPPKKEGRRYPRRGLGRVFLLAGLAVLWCAFTGTICGCGSNEGTPTSRQDKKKPALDSGAKPLVKEILPDGRQVVAVPQERLPGRVDPDSIEVAPPDVPGGRGLTVGDLKAAAIVSEAARPVDPDLEVVAPPDRPGGRALTVGDIKAAAALSEAARPADPDLEVVLPPEGPDKRALTVGDIKAAAALSAAARPVDPDLEEVAPPDVPGGRGMTLGEFKAKARATSR
jgi:ribosomal protein L13E